MVFTGVSAGGVGGALVLGCLAIGSARLAGVAMLALSVLLGARAARSRRQEDCRA